MEPKKRDWLRLIITVLVAEKIVQHVAVTAALAFDWYGIRSTVAVPPDALLLLGAIVAVLFAVALWGLVKQRRWAAGLVIGLALFDVLGEFVAQGTVGIQLNVSFLVASTLLILCLAYRRSAAAAVS